jgi:hypothetical protein
MYSLKMFSGCDISSVQGDNTDDHNHQGDTVRIKNIVNFKKEK